MKIIKFKTESNGKEYIYKDIPTIEQEWLIGTLPSIETNIKEVKVGIHTVCVGTIEELLIYLGVLEII